MLHQFLLKLHFVSWCSIILVFSKNRLTSWVISTHQYALLNCQLEDAGSSNLGHLLTRYITASTQHQLGSVDMNPSPGLSTLSPGSSGTYKLRKKRSLHPTELLFKCFFCILRLKVKRTLSDIQDIPDLIKRLLYHDKLCHINCKVWPHQLLPFLSAGLSNAHTPARPSSASSTGSRGR